MIKEALRIVAVFLLLLIIIMDDFPFYRKMKDTSTQFFLGLCVLLMIFYDVTFGFIMGLVLMLIYYEIYKKIILSHEKEMALQKDTKDTKDLKNQNDHKNPVAPSLSEPVAKIDYISEAHLLAAQNNIWDMNNFNLEVKGVDGIGAQGLRNGYDSSDMYSMW
jgi:hypothetical protein